MTAKLPFAVGLELTAVYRWHQERRGCVDPATICYLAKTVQTLRKMRYKSAHRDSHCVEWPTPVYKDWTKLQEDFQNFRYTTGNFYLVPRHPATVCGGGHIHINLPSLDAVLRFRDIVLQYPVIPWVFLHPCDTESANNPTVGENSCFAALDTARSQFTCSDGLASTKGHLIGASSCQKPNVVECRFFEAASSWQEQKLHLDFLFALAIYATTSQNLHKQPIFRTAKELNRIRLKQALAMFEELCALINFNMARCHRQITRNLKPRWNRGYKRT